MARKILVTLIVLLLPTAAWAAPADLKAMPVSAAQVDLKWTAQPAEIYRIWQSTDGATWQSVYTFSQPGASSYSAVYGIEGYVNYYFAVTTTSVSDYLYEAQVGVNAANEAGAFPPNRNAHTYFSDNTDLCGNCHQTHSSSGSKLLKFATVDDTCMSCHDGTGSNYIVTEGAVSKDGSASNLLISPAGPFGAIFEKSNVSSEPESIHTVGDEVYEAPGGNPLGSSEEWTEQLGCSSCHDAHNSGNYRMLTTNTPDNPDVRVKAYAVTDKANGEQYARYISGINELCMGCHKDYLAGPGAGHQEAAGTYDAGIKYRHPVGVSPASYSLAELTTTLPLQGTAGDNTDKIVCLTCHRAHGSTAVNNSPSGSGGEDSDGPTNMRNYLLRRDNMGVCQDCHKK